MGKKIAQAVKLAIIQGGIRNLDFHDQLRVARAMQILEAIPDKYDEINDKECKGLNTD